MSSLCKLSLWVYTPYLWNSQKGDYDHGIQQFIFFFRSADYFPFWENQAASTAARRRSSRCKSGTAVCNQWWRNSTMDSGKRREGNLILAFFHNMLTVRKRTIPCEPSFLWKETLWLLLQLAENEKDEVIFRKRPTATPAYCRIWHVLRYWYFRKRSSKRTRSILSEDTKKGNHSAKTDS